MSDIVARILEARDGIVAIRAVAVRDVVEAASMFGLPGEAWRYLQVAPESALDILQRTLERDLVYNNQIVAAREAAKLAEEFIEQFSLESPMFYTNGEWRMFERQERLFVGGGVTEKTCDAGILVLTRTRTACAWFADSD
jgi:hypothetical protein